MGHLGFEISRQVDDGYCVKGTFLDANTATDTKRLGDEGYARFGSHFNAELATADDWARLLALLAALARATFVAVDNGDTGQLFRHIGKPRGMDEDASLGAELGAM